MMYMKSPSSAMTRGDDEENDMGALRRTCQRLNVPAALARSASCFCASGCGCMCCIWVAVAFLPFFLYSTPGMALAGTSKGALGEELPREHLRPNAPPPTKRRL